MTTDPARENRPRRAATGGGPCFAQHPRVTSGQRSSFVERFRSAGVEVWSKPQHLRSFSVKRRNFLRRKSSFSERRRSILRRKRSFSSRRRSFLRSFCSSAQHLWSKVAPLRPSAPHRRTSEVHLWTSEVHLPSADTHRRTSGVPLPRAASRRTSAAHHTSPAPGGGCGRAQQGRRGTNGRDCVSLVHEPGTVMVVQPRPSGGTGRSWHPRSLFHHTHARHGSPPTEAQKTGRQSCHPPATTS